MTEKAHPGHYSNVNKDASSCYIEGKKAREAGYGPDINPYPVETGYFISWANGWCDEDTLIKDLQTIVIDYHKGE